MFYRASTVDYSNDRIVETKTSFTYVDDPLAGISLVFPEVEIEQRPHPEPIHDNETFFETDRLYTSEYCKTCSTSGFTTEPNASYQNVDFIVPNYSEYSHEYCIEECKNMPGCNTYRWQESGECYLIGETGQRRVDLNGKSGRSCLAVTECNAKELLVILSNEQTLGWTVQENCMYSKLWRIV